MPTPISQQQAMLRATPTHLVLPSKLRTGSGKITKPGKPTLKHYPSYNPHQNARRQRLAPKLRMMFMRFLLDRLEAQGIAVEDLPRSELRDQIAAMSDNFLALAANLERDERDVDDLAVSFGQIVVPSGADVGDVAELMDATSLRGGDDAVVGHDREAESTSSTAEGDNLTTEYPLPDGAGPQEDEYDDGIE